MLVIVLIDTHCHLNFKAFKKDLDQVIRRAKEAGVGKMIVIGSDLKSSQKAIELAQKYDEIYATVGIHPHHVNSLNSDTLEHRSKLQKTLTDLARQNKVVAIGETGLDYYRYKKSKYGLIKNNVARQRKFFLLHIKIAKKLNLPLIIHCRQAHDDLLEVLTEKSKSLPLKGVLHCFEGSRKHLEKSLNLGLYIGFNGLIAYPERKILKNLVKITPIEKILLETDSPFLAPEPFRGTRNEPKNVKMVAEKITSLKKIGLEEVVEKISGSTYSLFRIM